MAKINIPTINSGYASVSALNKAFQTLENELSDKVLYRDNPTGEPNSMKTDLDMNGYRILNQSNTVSLSGFNFSGDWLGPGTIYNAGDIISYDGSAYICTTGHTSSTTFSNDLAYWQALASNGFPDPIGHAGESLISNGISTEWKKPVFTQSGVDAVEVELETQAATILTPMQFGAIGDGITDDSAAIQATLNQAQVLASVIDEGTSVMIDLCGKRYALESGISFVNGGEGITIQNGKFVATGSSWTSADYMVTFSPWAARSRLLNVIIDGSMAAAGVDCQCGRPRIENCEIFHFKGIGLNIDGVAGDARVINNTIYELNNGDAEFLDNVNYTATALRVNNADGKYENNILKWTGLNLHLDSDSTTNTFIGGHLYNGGSGLLLKSRPKNLRAEYNVGANFIGTYFDNGEQDLYGDQINIMFVGCRAIWSDTASDLDYWIGLHATDNDATPGESKNGPWKFISTSWTYASLGLWDQTVPFIKFFSDDDTWAGSRTLIETIQGNKWFAEQLSISKAQTDSDPVLTLLSPSASTIGARLGLADGNTTSLSTIPYIMSSGDYIAFSKPFIPVGVSVTANKTYTTGEEVGQFIGVNSGATAITITMPNSEKIGAERTFYINSTTATVTFAVDTGGSIRTPYIATATSVPIADRQYSTVVLRCIGGSTGTAIYSIHIDGYPYYPGITSETATVTLAKNQSDDGFININNGGTAVTITLPNNNRIGYTTEIVQQGTGSVDVAVAAGGTINGYGMTAPITLSGRYATLRVRCTANATGTAASYTVTGQAA